MPARTLLDFGEDFSSHCLLPEDIWDKFQLSSLDLTMTCEIDLDSLDLFSNNSDYEIRNHDCMWAGHCGSKEHSVDDVKNILVRPISQIFQQSSASSTSNCAPVVNKQSPIAPGRSLLLKTQPQQQQQPQQLHQQTSTQIKENLNNAIDVLPIYDSPPNSDDEETKSPVLKFLQEAISEADMDDDDLYDYFEDSKDLISDDLEQDEEAVDVKVEILDEDHQPKNVSLANPIYNNIHVYGASNNNKVKNYGLSVSRSQFVNDHCYHKDKNASMRNLGIDTPSDSEEEIDVVSTDEKFMNSQRAVSALPTNPTTKDRQQIQKTMASAITKNGIRTISPRKSGSVEHSPSKRRSEVRGGIKRNRHRMSTSPYKKQNRVYHTHAHQMSSDSEQEPSEKRIEHNNMERQRRVDLRNAFEELRVLVPEVNKRERAPKVVILREAAVYCHKLTDISDTMKRQVDEMRRQQKRLRMRVSQLRSSLAPKHR